MKESTGVWLEPMFTEADKRGIDIREFARQSTMPAAEADSVAVNWLASCATEDVGVTAMDWMRLGQLLRERLGWEDYPERPGDAFVCEDCGYSRQVQLEDDHGREVTVMEYMAALRLLGERLLCSYCAARAGA